MVMYVLKAQGISWKTDLLNLNQKLPIIIRASSYIFMFIHEKTPIKRWYCEKSMP